MKNGTILNNRGNVRSDIIRSLKNAEKNLSKDNYIQYLDNIKYILKNYKIDHEDIFYMISEYIDKVNYIDMFYIVQIESDLKEIVDKLNKKK